MTSTATEPTQVPASTDWRRVVEPYTGSDARRSTFQLVTTLGLYALNVWLIHLALQWSSAWSIPLALLLTFPAAGLLGRTFIFMHDCTHSSFYENRRLNEIVGFVTGVLTFTPFEQWRRDHALHHASSGDLERRGHGDIPTRTVREYLAMSKRDRFLYRIVRQPVLLLLGGPFHLILGQRFRAKSRATKDKQQSSVLWTNVGIAIVGTAGVLTLGWQTVLFSWLLAYYIAAAAGIWLFYVQHQFEDAYWTSKPEWDYVEASLRGSSYLKLPKILNWFTGDIGLHHVHHVAPKIPNYRLQECHDKNEMFHSSPVLTLTSAMSCLKLALWDEDRQRMVSFKEASVR